MIVLPRRKKYSQHTISPVGYYRLGQAYSRTKLRQPYPQKGHSSFTNSILVVIASFVDVVENLRTINIAKTIHCDNTIQLDSSSAAVFGTMLGLNIIKQAIIGTTKELSQSNALPDSWLGSTYLFGILNYANKTQLSSAQAVPINWGGGTQQILRTDVFNLGWLTKLLKNNPIDLSSNINISRATQLTPEFLYGLLLKTPYDMDWLTKILKTNNIDVDNTLDITTRDEIVLTYLANLSVVRTQALSALAGLNFQGTIPVGNIGVSTVGYISLLDYLASTQPTKVFDIEALKGLITSQNLPLGWSAAGVVISKTDDAVIDWLTSLAASHDVVSGTTQELTPRGVFSIEYNVFVETQATLLKEWLFGLGLNVTDVIELLRTLSTSDIIPILWGSTSSYPTAQAVWVLDSRGRQWVLTNRLANWVLGR